jgi:hypothetical protein
VRLASGIETVLTDDERYVSDKIPGGEYLEVTVRILEIIFPLGSMISRRQTDTDCEPVQRYLKVTKGPYCRP